VAHKAGDAIAGFMARCYINAREFPFFGAIGNWKTIWA
jgi:hypothetical protein